MEQASAVTFDPKSVTFCVTIQKNVVFSGNFWVFAIFIMMKSGEIWGIMLQLCNTSL